MQTSAAGTAYTESDASNNWRCIDVSALISCDTGEDINYGAVGNVRFVRSRCVQFC